MRSTTGLGKILVVVVGLLTSGCTPPNPPAKTFQSFTLTAEDRERPVAWQIVLPQKDVFINPVLLQRTSAQALPCFGVVDCLFNAAAAGTLEGLQNAPTQAENRNRQSAAEETAKPLLGSRLNELFVSDLEVRWSAAVRSSTWMHTLSPVVKTDGQAVTPEELKNGPLLRMTARYFLQYDAATLRINVVFAMYRQGNTDPAYLETFDYYSDPTGSDKNAAAVQDWYANDFALMKSKMQEGNARIVDLAAHDLHF